ncbi:lytic transglycosylase F [Psychroflexus sp. S27]|uniref:transglycosylase SLT domain-containing protein n=1 Tax=Psychroflexus sp. S27 TaxID=1982757 RepID=UPI000C2990A0|nr:transporter substrate-binding domain-containing protein [Psychroflexus sp. S27]PJX23646.1 lytic transglycosylase F [Psychroflexus sp. S27]
MRILLLGLLIILFNACQSSNTSSSENTEIETPSVDRSFEEIKKDGVLRAITTYSSTTYFLYKGRPMGFEYEMLERLAESLDLELEIIIAEDEDKLIEMLNRGDADLLAYGFTITEGRKKKISFTNALYNSYQVLIQRKPEYWRQMKLHEIKNELITDPIELSGDTISVKKESSYADRIKNLSSEIGEEIYIDPIPGSWSADKIIKKIAEGEIKYTVADQNIAFINASYYPILDISTKVSFSQRIAWATRQNNPELLKVVNEWIMNAKKTTDYHVIYNKYFKNKRLFKRRVKSDFYSLNEGKISQYDDLIKKYANDTLNWDWRLLASVIYQESRFDPHEKSWVGAQGLMQIMPKTAEELKITNPNDPDQSVRGGSAYLTQMMAAHDKIQDSVQRIKFALASYNAGLYHIRDAQKLAESLGDDPLIWDENVEEAVLKLSSPKYYINKVVKYGYVRGLEPYNYVNEIFERYEHYQKFIDK